MKPHRTIGLGIFLAIVASTTVALGDLASLGAEKDNTLYFDNAGLLSNGAGGFFFAGSTSGFGPRRGLLAFDIAGSIPAGSTIDSVSLTLHVSRAQFSTSTVELHPALADWGEGASDAGEPGGAGITAEPGDATWLHTFYNTSFWTNPGGDFSAAASGSTSITDVGFYTWSSTSAMVADVQSWLDNPAANYGWVLLGDELGFQTAKRFDSRENIEPSFRPVLSISYTIPEPATLALLTLGLVALKRRRA